MLLSTRTIGVTPPASAVKESVTSAGNPERISRRMEGIVARSGAQGGVVAADLKGSA